MASRIGCWLQLHMHTHTTWNEIIGCFFPLEDLTNAERELQCHHVPAILPTRKLNPLFNHLTTPRLNSFIPSTPPLFPDSKHHSQPSASVPNQRTMDVLGALGIAANVIAVVDLAAKVGGVVYQYAKSAKDCPKTITKLHQELSAVQETVDGLRKIADRLDASAKEGGEPQPLLSKLSTALEECEGTLNSLMKELKGHFSNKLREKVGRRLKWPIKEAEVIEFIDRLGRYQQIFQQALQVDIASIALGVKKDVKEVKTEIRELHGKQAEDIDARASEAQLAFAVAFQCQTRGVCREASRGHRNMAIRKGYISTLGKYQSIEPLDTWNTRMCSTIIERLKTTFPPEGECGFAYFYCQYNKEDTKNPPYVIRTLLAQLIYGLSYTTTADTVRDLFSKLDQGHGPPSNCKELTNLVTKVSRFYSRSIVVIDGLDECPMELRWNLLDFISMLASCNTSILVLSRKEVDIEDGLQSFPTLSLEREQINLKNDMRKLINKEFEDTRKWGHRFQTMKEEIEESLILGSGKNMFRWLQCQLDLLNRLKTQKDIREALKKLPRTLFETYDRMLEYIEEESSAELVSKAFHWVVHSARSLKLEEVVAALALDENEKWLDLNATFSDPRDLLRVSSSLLYEGDKMRNDSEDGNSEDDDSEDVNSENDNSEDDSSKDGNSEEEKQVNNSEIEEPIEAQVRSNTKKFIRLCHYTVQEYLVSDYLHTHPRFSCFAVDKKGTDQVQSKLAKLTLKYLLVDDFSKPCISESELHERVERYGFYKYCAFYWFEHTYNVQQEDRDLLELVDSFVFGSPGHLRSYEQMMKTLYYDSQEGREKASNWLYRYRIEREQDHQLSGALFYNIIRSGFRWITKGILEKRPEILDKDVQDTGPPLRIAILASHEDIVRDLLLLGADRRKKCPTHDLRLSSPFSPRVDVTNISTNPYDPYDILLKYEGEPQYVPCPAKLSPFEYPIHAVSEFIPTLLPLFLQNGADDANLRGGDGSTPIHYAVLGRSLEAVQTLVAAGANINSETNSGRTALHIAVSLRCRSILDYLLDHNVIISSDIPIEMLKEVANADDDGEYDENYKHSAEGEDAAQILLEKIRKTYAQSTSGGLSPRIPNSWVRKVIQRAELILAGPGVSSNQLPMQEPYVSIAVNDKPPKRIVFKIRSYNFSKKYGSLHNDSCKSYRRPYSWLEASIVRTVPPLDLVGETSTDTVANPRTLPPRHIQINVHNSHTPRYHVVTWDIRDPTPGIKEWLDAIQPGDVIGVYPRAQTASWGSCMEMIEVEVYYES
ncbi:hypothetical protein K440DRAFT_660414 [Wilcoxina mikolae CBS 423.85]|nr:hypothetical protein K440DRAFT_660414 [Wilcoxina mikolae CBS 423.85]